MVANKGKDMTCKENREVGPRVQQNASTMASRLREFTRMNPPMFFMSKVNEDNQDILTEVYKIIYSMGVSSNKKVDLSSYQLKDVVQTWYTK